ncbi:NAD(P)-dependent oxidoreductase [Isoalcanivorax indicus]|uniref:NAD(P)-dependent oxidoreductase n=1 Tax=Isoalcanivorax indicus TaxID=2202653 RepID=UPI000DBA7F4D|nr:NAD(P)H-binding protein [Isoalcanivorax indicus]
MNIIIFGAAGNVGRRIAHEALRRGHTVTGVVRNKEQFGSLPEHVQPCAAEVSDPAQLSRTLDGQDLIISALRPPEGHEDALVTLTRSVLDGAIAHRLRALFVGGAARLRLPGRGEETVLSAPDFLPASTRQIARACQAQYHLCLNEHRADWTYLSPAAMLQPGTRTRQYRLDTDTLVVDANGTSRISMEDFAVAMLDEAEMPQHIRRAFTLGY